MKKRIPDYIFSIFLTLLMAIVFLYLCSLNSYAFEHGDIFLTVMYVILTTGLGIGLLFFIASDFRKIQHYRKTRPENSEL